MSAVGLLYVGAVLFVNGMSLLGWISPKGAAPMNFMVGFLQILTPTYLIFTSGGDPAVIAGAAGLYMFGFTYLYVALNSVTGWRPEGLGWFSFFVAVACVAFAAHAGLALGDWASSVLWLQWAVLWWLFFSVLGLGKAGLTKVTGSVCAIQGFITGGIPALLMLFGLWENSAVTVAALAVTGAANLVLARPLARILAKSSAVEDDLVLHA